MTSIMDEIPIELVRIIWFPTELILQKMGSPQSSFWCIKTSKSRGSILPPLQQPKLKHALVAETIYHPSPSLLARCLNTQCTRESGGHLYPLTAPQSHVGNPQVLCLRPGISLPCLHTWSPTHRATAREPVPCVRSVQLSYRFGVAYKSVPVSRNSSNPVLHRFRYLLGWTYFSLVSR